MNTAQWKIQVLDNVSRSGLARFPSESYQIDDQHPLPDGILLRSSSLHQTDLPDSVLAIGRAGAGVNNIPVDRMSDRGVPVFNAPGANANAVKELVIAGLLLSCRNIIQAANHTSSLSGTAAQIAKEVEVGKKQFGGFELPGKTLGVIGLGSIGRAVADTALQMGMRVIGHDPLLTVEGAWRLSRDIFRADSVQQVLANADFITFHVPLTDATRGMINAANVGDLRPGATVLNFARDGIVDNASVCEALDSGNLRAYITDFPSPELVSHPGVTSLPHLGASTIEAEENCARMVVDQVRDFIENGNIHNSVNFPDVRLARGTPHRVALANSNVPNMLGQISTAMARAGLNIHDMINQSRESLAFTIVDTDSPVSPETLAGLQSIDGVLCARVID